MSGADYIQATLGGRRFAFPRRRLLMVLDGARPTPVPLAPPGLIGLLRYENDLLPVFDAFGEPTPRPTRLLLVLEQDGEQGRLAYNADTIEGLLTLSEKAVAALSEAGAEIGVGLLSLGNENTDDKSD